MFRRFFNLFRSESEPSATLHQRRRTDAHAATRVVGTRRKPAARAEERIDSDLSIPELQRNNVLIRNRYHREDTGTHETLQILDDSIVDSGEVDGIDPYNSGEFDRARHWDKRFRN